MNDAVHENYGELMSLMVPDAGEHTSVWSIALRKWDIFSQAQELSLVRGGKTIHVSEAGEPSPWPAAGVKQIVV